MNACSSVSSSPRIDGQHVSGFESEHLEEVEDRPPLIPFHVRLELPHHLARRHLEFNRVLEKDCVDEAQHLPAAAVRDLAEVHGDRHRLRLDQHPRDR